MTSTSSDIAAATSGAVREVRLGSAGTVPALSTAMVTRLRRSIDPGALGGSRVLVLRSEGRAFCGGLDLSEPRPPGTAAARIEAIQDLLDTIRALPVVTIALLDGAAVGAGADLAMACDYRVGTPAASFRFPGTRFGLILGTDQLVRQAGAHRAADILLRNSRVGAEAALEGGLLTDLVDTAAAFGPFLDELVENMADLAPATIARLMRIVRSDDRGPHLDRLRESFGSDLEAALDRFAERGGMRSS